MSEETHPGVRQEPSHDPAGSRVLGALVVPTTIGLSAPALLETMPQPVSRDMEATAATLLRTRFWLNTRALLDPPFQGRQNVLSATPTRTAAKARCCRNVLCGRRHPGVSATVRRRRAVSIVACDVSVIAGSRGPSDKGERAELTQLH